jgi:hypothetical protein
MNYELEVMASQEQEVPQTPHLLIQNVNSQQIVPSIQLSLNSSQHSIQSNSLIDSNVNIIVENKRKRDYDSSDEQIVPQIDWSESETSSETNSMTMSPIFGDRLKTSTSSHSSGSSDSSIDWILNCWPKSEPKSSHNLVESRDNPLFNIKRKLISTKVGFNSKVTKKLSIFYDVFDDNNTSIPRIDFFDKQIFV